MKTLKANLKLSYQGMGHARLGVKLQGKEFYKNI
jgi:hypothetical protein